MTSRFTNLQALALIFGVSSACSAQALICEDLFEAKTAGTLLSPTTVTQKVLKKRIVRGLLQKQSNVMRAAQTVVNGPSVGGLSSQPARARITPPAVPRRRTYPLPTGTKALRIRWIDEGSFLIENGDPQPTVAGVPGYTQKAFVLPNGSGAPQAVELFEPNKDAHFDPMIIPVKAAPQGAPAGKVHAKRGSLHTDQNFFIVQEHDGKGYAYRFLDKIALRDMRPPLLDVTELKIFGNFIFFERQGRSYVTSLHASDFGPSSRLLDDREIPDGRVVNISADGSTLYVSQFLRNPERYRFDNGAQRYVPDNASKVEYELKGSDGAIYAVSDDGSSSLSLQRRGEKKTQQIKLAVDQHNLLQQFHLLPRVIDIVGEGEQRAVILTNPLPFSSGHEIIKIGDRALTDASVAGVSVRIQKDVKRFGDRFLVFTNNVQQMYPVSHPSPGFEVIVHVASSIVDRKNGRLYTLPEEFLDPGLSPSTTILDADHYVQVRPKRKNLVDYSEVHVHRLDSNEEIRSEIFEGAAHLVPGTHVLRIETSQQVSFVDINSSAQLWTNRTESHPRLSPDGSKVAYFEDGAVHIEVLGGYYESRKTY